MTASSVLPSCRPGKRRIAGACWEPCAASFWKRTHSSACGACSITTRSYICTLIFYTKERQNTQINPYKDVKIRTCMDMYMHVCHHMHIHTHTQIAHAYKYRVLIGGFNKFHSLFPFMTRDLQSDTAGGGAGWGKDDILFDRYTWAYRTWLCVLMYVCMHCCVCNQHQQPYL